MNIGKIKEEIKEEEGYRNSMYRDHLGFSTIGYGHLVLPTDKFKEGVKYSQKELEKVFDYDFAIAKQDAESLTKDLDVPEEVTEILQKKDFVTAGFEMEDSLWCKKHTPARALRLSEKMKKLT